jgi:hypothetical protein
MCRFAYDCMCEFNRLCQELEVELGPGVLLTLMILALLFPHDRLLTVSNSISDTADLAMRFGLHSGMFAVS